MRLVFQPLAMALSFLLVLSSCGGKPFWLPKAHRIDIQQGNLLTQEQIDRIKPGLSREDVRRLLGDPVLAQSFDSNRWDYVYTRGEAGEHVKASGITIHFNNELVSEIVHVDIEDDNQS